MAYRCSYSKPRGLHHDGFCLWNTVFSMCLSSVCLFSSYNSGKEKTLKTRLALQTSWDQAALQGTLSRGPRAMLDTSSSSREKQGSCEREVRCSSQDDKTASQAAGEGRGRWGAAEGRRWFWNWCFAVSDLCTVAPCFHVGVGLCLNLCDHLLEISVNETCVYARCWDHKDRRKQLLCTSAA